MYRTFLGIVNLIVAVICGVCFLIAMPNHPWVAALDMLMMILNLASGICALENDYGNADHL